MLERTPGLIPTEVFGTGRALDAAEDWAPIRSARVPDGLPVVVIARGQPDPHPPGGLDTAAWERVHGQLQDGFAHQFPSGVLWVAKKSGHLIPRDEPDIILRAIKSIIEQMPAR